MKAWAKPLRTLELASSVSDDEGIPRGPFTVIPIPGLTKAEIDGALSVLDAAVEKIRPKFSKVLYGKVYLSKHLKRGVAAWYDETSDSLSLNVAAKKRFDDVFTVIHELGHRHEKRFLNRENRTKFWDLSTRKTYEVIEFDAKLRGQMADEVVAMAKAKGAGHPMPAMSDTLVWWLKSPHPTGHIPKTTTKFLKGEIDEKALHAAVMGKHDAQVQTDKVLSGPLHVTPYGATNPGENYADGFAHFVLGKDMPAPLAAILADEQH